MCGRDASLKDQAIDLRRRYGARSRSRPAAIRDHFTSACTVSGRCQPAEAIAGQPSLAFDITAKATWWPSSPTVRRPRPGNIGPRAGCVMRAGILFHTFAGVEAFPICVATQTSDEIINIVKRIALLSVDQPRRHAAPRCFEIEDRLREALDFLSFTTTSTALPS